MSFYCAKHGMLLTPENDHTCVYCLRADNALLRQKLENVIDAFEIVIKFIPVGWPMPPGWHSTVDKVYSILIGESDGCIRI